MQNQPLYNAIISRRSTSKLSAPAPDRDVVTLMLKAAESAPDHGRLKPWRFYVVEGEALNALGEAYTRASTQFNTNDPKVLDKVRNMPLRAPMVIVATAVVTEGKIPEIEQYVSVGVAIQNMQLVAEEAGFAAMWRTGGVAYDPAIKALFDLGEQDQIIGFLYLGTSDATGEPRRDPVLTQGVSERAFCWYDAGKRAPFLKSS